MTQPAEVRICPKDHATELSHTVDGDGNGVDIYYCASCDVTYLAAGGQLVNLNELRDKLRLRDDQVRAAVSPDNKVLGGASIPVLLDIAWAAIHKDWLELDGQIRARMAQVQNRAHFLHGEIARQAMAHPELHPLVETAKQIIDFVAGRPDGITTNDGG